MRFYVKCRASLKGIRPAGYPQRWAAWFQDVLHEGERKLKHLNVRILTGSIALVCIVVIVFVGCLARVSRQVEREWQTANYSQLEIGVTKSLTILILFDKAVMRDALQAGFGVSYLVKTDQTTILRDSGNNREKISPSPVEHNMQQLGITLDEVDLVVLTHNHFDHVGGFNWWRKDTFSLGNTQANLTGKTVYVPEPLTYPGIKPIVAEKPMKLAEGVATMGTISFVEVFPFFLLHPRRTEQTLAVNVEGYGVVLISGCGHTTLQKIVTRAEQLFDVPVGGIVGGLHFKNKDAEELQTEIDFLRERKPRLVALSPHDSGSVARQTFRNAFPEAYQVVEVGQEIRLEAP